MVVSKYQNNNFLILENNELNMVENNARSNIVIFVPDEMRGDTVSLRGIYPRLFGSL